MKNVDIAYNGTLYHVTSILGAYSIVKTGSFWLTLASSKTDRKAMPTPDKKYYVSFARTVSSQYILSNIKKNENVEFHNVIIEIDIDDLRQRNASSRPINDLTHQSRSNSGEAEERIFYDLPSLKYKKLKCVRVALPFFQSFNPDHTVAFRHLAKLVALLHMNNVPFKLFNANDFNGFIRGHETERKRLLKYLVDNIKLTSAKDNRIEAIIRPKEFRLLKNIGYLVHTDPDSVIKKSGLEPEFHKKPYLGLSSELKNTIEEINNINSSSISRIGSQRLALQGRLMLDRSLRKMNAKSINELVEKLNKKWGFSPEFSEYEG